MYLFIFQKRLSMRLLTMEYKLFSRNRCVSKLSVRTMTLAVGAGLMTIALTACSVSSQSRTPTAKILPASPTQNTSGDESSSQAAVRVIRDYYSAIARQDYQQAYLDWDTEGSASQQSFEQFKQGFANTVSTTVEVGKPEAPNGSAGSVYLEVPVTVNAKTTNATLQRFHGSYVLRRVNNVSGSTPTQREWHLYSADLKPVT